MGAYDDMDAAFKGKQYGLENVCKTYCAAEAIEFGTPVFGYSDDAVNAYNYSNDETTLTLDADLVTSNVYTITLTIDGVAQTAVATTFDTDHDTTMDAVKAALEAAFSTATVTLTDATDNRAVKIFIKGKELSAAGVVTAGGSQAEATNEVSTAQIFLGVAASEQKYVDASSNEYAQYDAMTVVIEGWVWIETSTDVDANDDAYVVKTDGSDQGTFGTSGYATNAKYATTTSDDLALLEVRRSYEDTSS